MPEPKDRRPIGDHRFRDTQETLYDFTEEYLVVCPQKTHPSFKGNRPFGR